MPEGNRWKQRYRNFDTAYQTFSRMLDRYQSMPSDEAVQMALVQAFESTFELAWNTMKDYLEYEGFNDVKSGRQAIRTAFQSGLIADGEGWMKILERRNLATHTYNSGILTESVSFIVTTFAPLARALHEDLKSRL